MESFEREVAKIHRRRMAAGALQGLATIILVAAMFLLASA